MTNTQKIIKDLFDAGNEIVQDYMLYSSIVWHISEWDEFVKKSKKELSDKYGSLSKLVTLYMQLIREQKNLSLKQKYE